MLSLAELPMAFAGARAQTLVAARSVAASLCRYCGKRWTPLPTGRLDGHALCVVTLEFREALDELLRSSATITRHQVADLLGVPHSTIKAWTKPRTVERGPRWGEQTERPTALERERRRREHARTTT
jgi:hypothetical protein